MRFKEFKGTIIWDNGLRQTWKEEYLKFVPEIYRQFAVEVEE